MEEIKYPILGYAPGWYANKCVSCGENFMGDKLATQCKICAINTLNEGYHRLQKELKKYKPPVKTYSDDSLSYPPWSNE